MELNKKKWTKKDILELNKYLKSIRNDDKIKWTKNILNTKMEVFAIKAPVLKDMASKIYNGNYKSFLGHMSFDSYEISYINGCIISKIKDFSLVSAYLNIYSEKIDNWASCDVLKIDIHNNEDNYLNLINTYIKSTKPFVQRTGLIILFRYIKYEKYIPKIFNILNKFENNEEYYVNMINAWIICECFIKHREKTIIYLNNNSLNKFTINKAISKCRDSFRINDEDKDYLLKFKK